MPSFGRTHVGMLCGEIICYFTIVLELKLKPLETQSCWKGIRNRSKNGRTPPRDPYLSSQTRQDEG